MVKYLKNLLELNRITLLSLAFVNLKSIWYVGGRLVRGQFR
jgi:hypothetical protein